MEAIRLHAVIEKDGEILLTKLPYTKGQQVEMILLAESGAASPRPRLTARRLLHSGIIGLWKDRQDIQDSALYARQLREQAQNSKS